MSTKTETWMLKELRAAKQDPGVPVEVDANRPIVFQIPRFQRSLVWPELKKKNLIESILRGYPFGSLLLVERPNKEVVTLIDGSTVSATAYAIIDGLQRVNAIVDHLRTSLLYASDEVLEGPEFDHFRVELEHQSGVQIAGDELKLALLPWMRDTRHPDVASGFDHSTMIDAVAGSLGMAEWTRKQETALRSSANKFLAYLSTRLDVGSLTVPVLIYSGPSENLPEIFERINTSGTVLSKYEVFAAAWMSTAVTVKRTDIKTAVARRYKLLEDEGFTVGGDTTSAEYSLFDYLHGLSQVLGEQYPRLFSKKAAKDGRLSAAFPLATLMFGYPIDQMGKLDKIFPKNKNGSLEVEPFERALLAATKQVDDFLAGFLGFQFVSDNDSLAHGDLQIISMIAAVAVHLYDHEKAFAWRGTAAVRRRRIKSFAHALPQHYIYDILRQQWRGALYTYAFQRVWENGKPSQIYAVAVDGKSFDSTLSTSLTEQLSDLTHKRRNITAADRVFLKFLYSKRVTVADQKTNKFDVEHLIPVSRIQTMTAGRDPWALGALGNLAVLPAGPNRLKRDETVQEYLSRRVKPPTPMVAALINSLLFVKAHEVAIPKNGKIDVMTKAEYDAFVKKNWSLMAKSLKKSLGIT